MTGPSYAMRLAFAAALGAASSRSAGAGGYSAEVELVRPAFSAGGLPGIDTPRMGPPGVARVGLLAQYEQDPLVLFEGQVELGAVVAERGAVHAGASWDFAKGVSARAVMPGAYQWNSDIPELGADGVAVGDASIGIRARAVELGRAPGWGGGALGARPVALGLRMDMLLPTGTAAAWTGEDNVRTAGGLLASLALGPVESLVDAGFVARSRVDTDEDMVLGSEATAAAGLRVTVLGTPAVVVVTRGRGVPSPGGLDIHASVLGRGGFPNFLKGGAENAAEAIGGVQVRLGRALCVDAGAGRGLADGYGTTQLRAYGGLLWTPPARAPRRPPETVEIPPVEEPPPVIVLTDEPPPVKVEWHEGELARVEKKEIVIRDPIQFEFATPNILPVSFPTLEYVAGLLNSQGRIAHVVIEGHASEEGTYLYNYRLSMSRANAVFEKLVEAGVHPARLSTRSMGEVVAVTPGSTEETLAPNRRVQFHIVRVLDPLDLEPSYDMSVHLPWTGEPGHYVMPPPVTGEEPVVPPPPEEPAVDPNRFDDEGGG